jgi:predicted O-methyltransferase YrrM
MTRQTAGDVGRVAYALGRNLLRHPVKFLKHIAKQAKNFEKYQTVDSIVEERLRVFLNSPPTALLPQRSLEDICGGATKPVEFSSEPGDGAELPEAEEQAIARIVAARRPAAIFEIGTYRGRTTRLLATCSPSSIVHTLDLPPHDMLQGGCFKESDRELIGGRFAHAAHLRARIVQHFGDSQRFDFRPFYGQVDLVFVDACHAYEEVLNDSRAAIRMIKGGGTIIWDDYHPIHGPGVMKALADIALVSPLFWITGTRLATYCGAGDGALR